jgi:hypothetical protein
MPSWAILQPKSIRLQPAAPTNAGLWSRCPFWCPLVAEINPLLMLATSTWCKYTKWCYSQLTHLP